MPHSTNHVGRQMVEEHITARLGKTPKASCREGSAHFFGNQKAGLVTSNSSVSKVRRCLWVTKCAINQVALVVIIGPERDVTKLPCKDSNVYAEVPVLKEGRFALHSMVGGKTFESPGH